MEISGHVQIALYATGTSTAIMDFGGWPNPPAKRRRVDDGSRRVPLVWNELARPILDDLHNAVSALPSERDEMDYLSSSRATETGNDNARNNQVHVETASLLLGDKEYFRWANACKFYLVDDDCLIQEQRRCHHRNFNLLTFRVAHKKYISVIRSRSRTCAR